MNQQLIEIAKALGVKDADKLNVELSVGQAFQLEHHHVLYITEDKDIHIHEFSIGMDDGSSIAVFIDTEINGWASLDSKEYKVYLSPSEQYTFKASSTSAERRNQLAKIAGGGTVSYLIEMVDTTRVLMNSYSIAKGKPSKTFFQSVVAFFKG